jgi:hypothetical protein
LFPPWTLKTLVLALPVLVVAIGVVFSAAALAAGMGDEAGARLLRWWAIAGILLLAIDGILLLAVLGLRAMEADDRRTDDHRDE